MMNMKRIATLVFTLMAVPAFADTITVSVPACFVHEFEALGDAVEQIRSKAHELCSKATAVQSTAIIGETYVDRTASCAGFKISAVVECIPTDGDH